MNIKLEYYKIFYHAAKEMNFSKAAAELYITQSAVSQAVKSLENQLEIPLFIRSNKKVALTSEGEMLYEYVENALSLLDTAEKQIQKIKEFEMGELKIGVGDTISRYLLIPYLEMFNKKHPKIKLQIINRTSRETVSLLKAGKIDIAFVNLPIEDDTIDIKEYMEIHDVFVAGERFKQLKNNILTLEEISKLPLVLLEKTSNSRNYVERFLLSRGVKITPEIELGSHDLLLEFARINLGVSCVTREFSKHYLTTGELFEIHASEEIPKRSIGICTLKGVSASIAAEDFIKLLERKLT
ncbi:LysR family transcriptional regulator [Clostridium polynesiense]|uniref:LysR family transcriptional regulator n=1 Tax=Clostridium polynesiense TaxID=1325933 RepID=UPI00058C0202|nr:LysR family transcriptional regulator [Clostridium polynesiense]